VAPRGKHARPSTCLAGGHGREGEGVRAVVLGTVLPNAASPARAVPGNGVEPQCRAPRGAGRSVRPVGRSVQNGTFQEISERTES